jgi:branched-chain amino acid transport system permease protein
MSARTSLLIVALAVLVLLAAPFYLAPFTITLLNYIGVYSFVALGLVLLTGVAGMVSFGQASFMGIAAYATAWTSAIMGF